MGVLLILTAGAWGLATTTQVTISWEQMVEAGSGRTDVFFSDRQTAVFKPNDRISFFFEQGRWRRIEHTFTTFGLSQNRFLRIDPSMFPSLISMRDLRVGDHAIDLHDRLVSNQIRLEPSTSGVFSFRATGDDAYLVMDLSDLLARAQPFHPIATIVAWVLSLVFAALVMRRSNRLLLLSLSSKVIEYCALRWFQLIWLVVAIGFAAVIVSATTIARNTPFLQGPDEVVHVGNSFFVFHQMRYRDSEVSCPEVWVAINKIFNVVEGMRNNPPAAVNENMVRQLATLKSDKDFRVEDRPGLNPRGCETSNWFHRYTFNLPPLAMSSLHSDYDAFDYLHHLRLGNILTALGLTCLIAMIILRGRSIFADRLKMDQASVRASLVLGVFVYLAIPQNLFMISVVSKEAYYLPMGIFAFISLFYVRPILTPALFVVFIWACWPRRAPYLLMLGIPLTYYVFLIFQSSHRAKHWFQWLPIFLVVFLASLPVMFMWLAEYRETLPFRFPVTLMVENDPWHFYKEILDYLWDALTLQWFRESSFFGVLGSMDAPVHAWMPSYYKMTMQFVALLAVMGILTRRALARGQLMIRGTALFYGQQWQYLAYFPVAAAVITYAAHQVYFVPSQGLNWGVGIQGRYYLPTYFFIVGYLFICIGMVFSPACSGATQYTRRNVGAAYSAMHSLGYLGVLVSVTILVILMCVWTVDVIVARYYHSSSVHELFLSFTSQGRI